MNDPVLNDLARHLADIDADDSRQEAVDSLAAEIQGDIDVLMGGTNYRGKASWLNGRSCIDLAIEEFDLGADSVNDLLVAIGSGSSTEAAIEAIRRELKALAYEAATVRADRIIDDE